MKKLTLCLLSASLSIPAALAQAGESPALILNQVHHINQKEIRLSQLALKQGERAEVKDFAKMMINQHQAADQKVAALAKSKKIDLRSFQPADFETVAVDQLKQLKGAPFDQAFMDAMKSGHQHAARDLQEAKDGTNDEQVKALLGEILPTVKHHESMASNIVDGHSGEMAGQLGN
jgi:putative membrane protein